MKRSFYSLLLIATFFLSTDLEAKEHRISLIGISHSGCYGTCPVYSFLVKNDGTFEYNGYRFVSHKGEHQGTVDPKALRQVLKLIASSDFMSLKDKYRRGITDMDTAYTTVVMDGKKKIVEDYANAGPPELRSIEQSIEKLLKSAKWEKP